MCIRVPDCSQSLKPAMSEISSNATAAIPAPRIGGERRANSSTPVVRARGRWLLVAACAAVLVGSLATDIWIDRDLTATLASERIASRVEQWDAALHGLLQPIVLSSAALAGAHRLQSLNELRRARSALAEQTSFLARATSVAGQWFVVGLDGELLAGSDLSMSDWSAARRRELLAPDAVAQAGARAAFGVSADDRDRLNIMTPLRLSDGSVVGMVLVRVPMEALRELAQRLLGPDQWVLMQVGQRSLFEYSGEGRQLPAQATDALALLAQSVPPRAAPTLRTLAADDGARQWWVASREQAQYGLTTTFAVLPGEPAASGRLRWLPRVLGLAALAGLLVLALRYRTRSRERLTQAARRVEDTRRAYQHVLNQVSQPLAISDPTGSSTYINPALVSMLQVERASSVEQAVDWQHWVAEADWPDWCAAVQRAQQSGQVQWLRVSFRIDGVDHAVMAQLVPFGGETDGSRGVCLAVLLRMAANTGAMPSYFHVRELLHMAEAEKWRFGQALHDELGQRLAGMAFMAKSLERKLRNAQRPEADDALWLSVLAKESISATRGLARGLVPVDGDDPVALTAALAELCRTLATTFSAHCALESDPRFDAGGSAQANHLYHVAQELMTNAFKHGQARAVVVRLEVHQQGQRLVVHNDGIALDLVAMKTRRGMGLSGIRSRATYLGGHFTLRDEPQGTGVAAIIELPLPTAVRSSPAS